MKSLSQAMLDHLAGDVHTLAYCATITRTDGVVLRFTSHQFDLRIDGQVYVANAGFAASAYASSDDDQADNQDFLGIIDSHLITDADIKNGKYRGAKVRTFVVNYNNIAAGQIKIGNGEIAEVALQRGVWMPKYKSEIDKLAQQVGEVLSPVCRVPLGSAECGVDLSSYTVSGSVESATDARVFVDTARIESDNWFQFGILTWTSGKNTGLSQDVKRNIQAIATVELKQPMPNVIEPGDQYSMHAGCNHLLKADGDTWGAPYTGHCRSKFNNVANFRGEPECPGVDRLLGG